MVPEYTKRGRLFTDLILSIFRNNGLLLEWGDQLTGPLGLTSSRWQVLGAVDAGEATVAALARRMGLKRQSVQRTVDLLVKEGYLLLKENPEHRRARIVGFTESGREAIQRINRSYAKWANLTSEGWTERELSCALKLLSDLERITKEEFREG